MAPVARGLADLFRVVEPLQCGSGVEPLTVSRHIADLHEVIQSYCGAARPALVGSSWGAMLALAYAAEHSQLVGPLVLIGCGTFDPVARSQMQATIENRMDDHLRQRLQHLAEEFADPDQRMRAYGELILPLYSYELMSNDREHDQEIEACDARAYDETWADMVRLQAQSIYPAAFSTIKTPVIMLHGAIDPHPGRMILASLKPYLPQIEYHEWERCGHYPWLERAVRDDFFSVLRRWLARHLTTNSAPVNP
jgi:pimeloyl-ACP methyl ester carboxylesterase